MKHRIFALILALVLALGLTVPAAALVQYDYLTLEILEMDNDRLQTQGLTTLPNISTQYGFDLRVEIVSTVEGDDLYAYGESLYQNNDYGYGENKDGTLLMIQVEDYGGSVDIRDYAVIGSGTGSALLSKTDSTLLFESLDMITMGIGLDYVSAGVLCADAVDAYAGMMSILLDQNMNAPVISDDAAPEAPTQEAPADQTLSTAQQSFITDNAGLLTQDERDALEEQAEELAEEYGCGVYVLTVDTMTGAERRAFAEDYYTNRNLGLGEERNGILFLVCMDSRDYVTVTYGQNPSNSGDYGMGILAFTDGGIAAMEDKVVPMLTDGKYNKAFETYLDTCEDYLSYFAKHDEGKVPQEKAPVLLRLAIVVLVPLLIALIVCLVLRSRMKTVKPATTARDYIPGDSFALTAQRDHFVHTSRHREKIQKSSGSGSGTTVSSSGFGGSKGGKF